MCSNVLWQVVAYFYPLSLGLLTEKYCNLPQKKRSFFNGQSKSGFRTKQVSLLIKMSNEIATLDSSGWSFQRRLDVQCVLSKRI